MLTLGGGNMEFSGNCSYPDRKLFGFRIDRFAPITAIFPALLAGDAHQPLANARGLLPTPGRGAGLPDDDLPAHAVVAGSGFTPEQVTVLWQEINVERGCTLAFRPTPASRG